MKNQLIILLFLLLSSVGFAQQTEYKEYSYTQLFEMIATETDSIFELNDAIIKIDSISDKQFILNQLKRQNLPAPLETKVQINKHIAFNNVIFDSRGAIFDFSFNKSLKLVNCINFYLYNSEIEKDFSYIVNKDFNINIDHQMRGHNQIIKNTFSGRIDVILNSLSSSRFYYHLNFDENNIDIKDVVLNKKNSLRNSDVYFENNLFSSLLSIEGNRFRLGNYSFALTSSDFVLTDGLDNKNIFLIKNDFSESKSARIFLEGLQRLELIDNIFPLYIELTISEMRIKHVISWNDFKNKIINSRTANMAYYNNDYNNWNTFYSDLFKKLRVEDEYVYNGEMKIRGQFIDYYKRLRNLKSSNSAYVEMKDLETERLKYLHEQNTTFETFFTFKINQFLKVFSAYGTKPARAIVFSIYVILIFALIYLFFPNSWDKHGKNRCRSL